MQGNMFTTDFYVIDLYRTDVVLGVAWQESLGDLKLNYQKSYMNFNHNSVQVCL